MEIHVESAGGLSRRLHVKIPYERFERELGQRLRQLATRVRIPGFRPGKAPLKVVQQQYGESARQDVIGELVRQTWPEALAQAQVQPAGSPNFEIVSEKAGEPLAYVASFDVYPEVTLDQLGSLEVRRPAVEITDADVERLIGNLRKARRSLDVVSRPAQVGDVVVVDFDGSLDGQPFGGGKGENVEIEIGQHQFLPELENAIVGHSAGDKFDADVTFPADYRREDLRDKTARFAVELKEIKEPRLPEIDGEFLVAHGVEESAGEAGLRDKCRHALEAERDKAIRTRVKREVLDQLLATHPIEVPKSQVDQEVVRLREEAINRMQLNRAGGKIKPGQLEQMLPDALFESNAQRRVALGLLIGEVIKARGIAPDAARVEQALSEIAADYEQPEEVKQFYRSRPDMMQGLQAVVLEEQVVESLVAGASTVELKMTLEDLLKSVTPSAGS
ncbi:MAG: trigger factor [Nevskia sp.]|nr:trigger factor [Nevskia sp.]